MQESNLAKNMIGVALSAFPAAERQLIVPNLLIKHLCLVIHLHWKFQCQLTAPIRKMMLT
jgi:hypothetical protein